MAEKRIVIFDLDGTLINSVPAQSTLFCELLQERCAIPAAVSLPIYTELIGKGPRLQFMEILRRAESLDEGLVETLTRDYWLAAEAFEPVLFPEVLEVLTRLRLSGHTLVVSSGGSPAIVERVTRLTGIERFFRLVLGSQDGLSDMAKGPGHFKLIRESLNLTESALQKSGLFVGDGVFDMQVARQAGILAVGRLTGDNARVLQEAGAQKLVADLREILTLIEGG